MHREPSLGLETTTAVSSRFRWEDGRGTVPRALLGADLSGAGTAIGRVAGFGLLSLGIACWPGTGEDVSKPSALRAMFAYNLLTAIYLTYIRLGGEWVGTLLLPALVLHAVLTVLLVRGWWVNRQTERTKEGALSS